MASENRSWRLEEEKAAAMFYACALDLLAQTEQQHRAVGQAHSRLEACLAEWKTQPPTRVGRYDRLTEISSVVRDVLAAIRIQRVLASDMQRALSAMQANVEKT